MLGKTDKPSDSELSPVVLRHLAWFGNFIEEHVSARHV